MEHSTKRLIAVVSVLVIATAGGLTGLGTAQPSDQIKITVTDSSNGQDNETVGITVEEAAPEPADPLNVETNVSLITANQSTPVEVTVTNATSDEGLADATVEAVGQTASTGADGTAVFTLNITDSLDEVTVNGSFPGFVDNSTTIAVSSGGEVPSGFPASAERFSAIDSGDDGTLGPIEIAQAISENNRQGSVGGVEISPIEFAQIISWNADQ